MILPSYNFAVSISRLFDDYELKALCALEFQSSYLDCSKKCEYRGSPGPQTQPVSFQTSTLKLRLYGWHKVEMKLFHGTRTGRFAKPLCHFVC